MKVKDVVMTAASLLGLNQQTQPYLEGETENGKQIVDGLLEAFQLVESELALDYVPLITQERLETENGKAAYEQFSKPVSRVLAVTNGQGVELAFQIFPTYLQTDGKEITVKYAYLPQVKGIDEESDYQSRVSVGLMAYGVAAEYCAAQGLYAESAFWNKKYKESIAKACQNPRGGRMRSRIWV